MPRAGNRPTLRASSQRINTRRLNFVVECRVQRSACSNGNKTKLSTYGTAPRPNRTISWCIKEPPMTSRELPVTTLEQAQTEARHQKAIICGEHA